MAKRLYYPKLVYVLRGVCVYIQRYKPQLEKTLLENFGENAVLALGAVLVACDAFTELIDLEINP